MAIIQKIDTAPKFRDEFRAYGRGDQFSYHALGALFDWYDNLGEDIELDVIAICCDWGEYDDVLEACRELHPDQDWVDGATSDEMLEWLHDHFTVLQWGAGSVLVSH